MPATAGSAAGTRPAHTPGPRDARSRCSCAARPAAPLLAPTSGTGPGCPGNSGPAARRSAPAQPSPAAIAPPRRRWPPAPAPQCVAARASTLLPPAVRAGRRGTAPRGVVSPAPTGHRPPPAPGRLAQHRPAAARVKRRQADVPGRGAADTRRAWRRRCAAARSLALARPGRVPGPRHRAPAARRRAPVRGPAGTPAARWSARSRRGARAQCAPPYAGAGLARNCRQRCP